RKAATRLVARDFACVGNTAEPPNLQACLTARLRMRNKYAATMRYRFARGGAFSTGRRPRCCFRLPNEIPKQLRPEPRRPCRHAECRDLCRVTPRTQRRRRRNTRQLESFLT